MPARMARLEERHALKWRSLLGYCLGKTSQNPSGKYSLYGTSRGAIKSVLKGKSRPSNVPQETTMIEIIFSISLPSLFARNILSHFSLGGVR
jgi:hypothetical protein